MVDGIGLCVRMYMREDLRESAFAIILYLYYMGSRQRKGTSSASFQIISFS